MTELKRELEPVMSPEFSQAEVDGALLLLAKTGSAIRTCEALREIGMDIKVDRLRSWKTRQYPIRYADIVERHASELNDIAAERAREAYMKLSEVEDQLIDRLADNVQRLDPRDLASAIRNTTSAKGVNFDKHSLAIGRPTVITQTRTADENLRLLAGLFTDSTAEEIEDADEVDSQGIDGQA